MGVPLNSRAHLDSWFVAFKLFWALALCLRFLAISIYLRINGSCASETTLPSPCKLMIFGAVTKQ
jgi:hypothetical protein